MTLGWIHLGSYGLYNGVVGALLVERTRQGADALIWFGAAMAVHFLVNDHALAENHGPLYRRWGRWLVGVGTPGRMGGPPPWMSSRTVPWAS